MGPKGGAAIGTVVALVVMGLLAVIARVTPDGMVLGWLVVLATPLAMLLAFVSGWTLHEYEGIVIYMVAIPLTLIALGAIGGAAVGVVNVRSGRVPSRGD